MKRLGRIVLVFCGILGLAAASLAIAISYTGPCDSSSPRAATNSPMQAALARCYGGPEVLTIETVPMPTLADDEVLVRVYAAGLNPHDWHSMRGEPYFMRIGAGFGRPEDPFVGVDFAGTVEAIGKKVTRFSKGDAVFGGRGGAVAEYVVAREQGSIVAKPDNVTFEEAGGVAIAAITALQGLRDRGNIQPGHKVLINGASGGVGTFAIQIAKAYGAEVTAVCSTRNLELVRSLGADQVVDYTQKNFTDTTTRYDLILDNVGTQSISAMRGVLQPDGRIVIVGGTSRDPWIGPLLGPIKAALISPFIEQKVGMFVAQMHQSDLATLSTLMESGKVRTAIDKTYPMSEVAAAMEYLETGRARGKVIVKIVE
jgi:NADPH:quinone reductase-like Zn-dependent oxidoreductase